MPKAKCTCVYATSANTPSVRSGHEMGGYLKKECPVCKAERKAHEAAEDAKPKWIDRVMEQAQVFASAWSSVGGPFDTGDMLALAEQERKNLRRMSEEGDDAPTA